MTETVKSNIVSEEWRDIKGYEGIYQISNLGNIRNSKGVLIKPRYDKSGYAIKNLYQHGKYKTCKIHRLVAEAFIPNPDNLPCINHKDEVKSNNHVDNLEWCTVAYNNNYGTGTARRAASSTGRKRSFESRQRMSQARRKYIQDNPNAGKEHGIKLKKLHEENPEIREKISASKKEYFSHPEARIELGKRTKRYFEEHPEARIHLSELHKARFANPEEREKVRRRQISRYSDPNEREKLRERMRSKMKPIVQLDLSGNFIKEWESARGTAKTLGILQCGIQHCLKGRNKSYKGFIWKYKSDYEKESA